MRGLAFILLFAFSVSAAAQPYPVKNVNQEYVLKEFPTPNLNLFQNIVRDKNGLYWFITSYTVSSFDGINWKQYNLKSAKGENAFIRLNDLWIAESGDILLATSDGIFVYNIPTDDFILFNIKYPNADKSPLSINAFVPGSTDIIYFKSHGVDGFFSFDWKTKKFRNIGNEHIGTEQSSGDGSLLPLAADSKGNVWGVADKNEGIWNYNAVTGKLRRSWKGDLPEFASPRFHDVGMIVYSEQENVLWMLHNRRNYLEKIDLSSGQSGFYSFTETLSVRNDTLSEQRHSLLELNQDKEGYLWLRVAGKYLVKLDKDIRNLTFLSFTSELFAAHRLITFGTEAKIRAGREVNNIHLWIFGDSKLYTAGRRGNKIQNVSYDSAAFPRIKWTDFENTTERNSVFFSNGANGGYNIFVQNEGKTKIVWLDENLQVTNAFYDEEWKKYPAYFNKRFNKDSIYIALLRPGLEPLDLRKVILKEFRVDLRNQTRQEVRSDFRQIITRYGSSDGKGTFWLFSAGTLYSFDPITEKLDSLFICKPAEKRPFSLEYIKGYDFPTVLHKETNTFWIDFTQDREIYKIDLTKKKIQNIIRTCVDQPDCDIPGGIYDMYYFDADHIYLQDGSSAWLMNVHSDSATSYPDLFGINLIRRNPSGSGYYKDWIYYVIPSRIYLVNRKTRNVKEIRYEEYKWRISQLNSTPVVNERGELVLLCSVDKGFLRIQLDSVIATRMPGNVQLSFVRVDDKALILDSSMITNGLALKFNKYNNIQIGFSDRSIYDPTVMGFQYSLYKGGDTLWNKISGTPMLTISGLSPGKYQLLLRASNAVGDFSEKLTLFMIFIKPPFIQTGWFKLIVLVFLGLVVYALYRYRMKQLLRLQAVRNNIASDLHDDIGSTLNSISIYSEVAKQQAEKEIPALDLIGKNSRAIIESMSDIVWTINPENDSFEKIIVRMRSFAYQLLKAKNIEYTFEVDEDLNSIKLPMQVRKNFYLVFKESITNLLKYSGATRVAISLVLENKMIKLLIRDNGKGIPENAETQGNGLINMKKRAREIQADLTIHSANGDGTAIELMLKT